MQGDEPVAVYWATLANARPGLTRLLDPAERSRRDAYRQPDDADRFLLGAALLRLLAGVRLGIDPAGVAIGRECEVCGKPHGKPRLPGSLEASVSHSGGRIGVALTTAHPVGLDVERLDDRVDVAGLAERVLTERERAGLGGGSPRERLSRFTRCWVRKEAVLKCTGDGLRLDPRDVRTNGPEFPAEVIHWPQRPDLVHELQLFDLPMIDDHVVALAVVASRPVFVEEHDATALLAAC